MPTTAGPRVLIQRTGRATWTSRLRFVDTILGCVELGSRFVTSLGSRLGGCLGWYGGDPARLRVLQILCVSMAFGAAGPVLRPGVPG
jgi:hypothetical protein